LETSEFPYFWQEEAGARALVLLASNTAAGGIAACEARRKINGMRRKARRLGKSVN